MVALTAPASVATTLVAAGQWHHYQIDITMVVGEKDLTQAFLVRGDWFNFGGAPRGAFVGFATPTGRDDMRLAENHRSAANSAHGNAVATRTRL